MTQLSLSCSLGTLALNRQTHVDVPVADGTDVVNVRVLSSTTDPVPVNNVWSVVQGGISLDRSLSGVISADRARPGQLTENPR